MILSAALCLLKFVDLVGWRVTGCPVSWLPVSGWVVLVLMGMRQG